MLRFCLSAFASLLATALLAPGKSSTAHAAQTGIASYYWQGTQTASGERFNPSAMTAAHRTLPFGTHVRVTHIASGRSVVVRINDRGPFIKGRIIDLSRGAAGKLGIRSAGIAKVKVEVIGRSSGKVASSKKGKRSTIASKQRKSKVASLKRKQKAGSAAFVTTPKKTQPAAAYRAGNGKRADLV